MIEAAEGRADQLVAHAERDARDLRTRALEDSLAAIERLEGELAELRAWLLTELDALAVPPGAEPAVAALERRRPRRTRARASMRDRPVAALFGVAGGELSETVPP